jgi:hypothetical protein
VQAKKRKDRKHDDDKADEIDDTVHVRFLQHLKLATASHVPTKIEVPDILWGSPKGVASARVAYTHEARGIGPERRQPPLGYFSGMP